MLAQDASRFRRHVRQFPNGRSAFKAILQGLDWSDGRTLLLPAYIGWSAREGSGVFDPVRELGIPFAFYKITRRLEVDLAELFRQLDCHPSAALVVIHYFGRVDPGYARIVARAKEAGAEIVEDEAHALLTDFVGGLSGRAGRHAFTSFHKLLPTSGGGAWLSSQPPAPELFTGAPILQTFDLNRIAAVRRRNFESLTLLLQPLSDLVEPIWPQLAPGEVPQTLPLILRRGATGRGYRDRVYAAMNERGFGVVSLYHTMIPELDEGAFPESVALSRTIMNLPIHQDLQAEHLEAMVEALAAVLRDTKPD
jgi:dTDP-4-amino-4,6-dideoxygalactose transaminase